MKLLFIFPQFLLIDLILTDFTKRWPLKFCEYKHMQGLSVPFAYVGSGDPVRVLCLYTTNTLDIF